MLAYERLVHSKCKNHRDACNQVKFEDFQYANLKVKAKNIEEAIQNTRAMEYDFASLGKTSLPKYEPVFTEFQRIRNLSGENTVIPRMLYEAEQLAYTPPDEMRDDQRFLLQSLDELTSGMISVREFGRRQREFFPSPGQVRRSRSAMSPEERAKSADERALEEFIRGRTMERRRVMERDRPPSPPMREPEIKQEEPEVKQEE